MELLNFYIFITYFLTASMFCIILPFIFPIFILTFFYTSISCIVIINYLFFLIFKLTNNYNLLPIFKYLNKLLLNGVCLIWILHGKILHRYSVENLENIEKGVPNLLIYYHGALPIDLYYLAGYIIVYHKKLIYNVADNFLFNIPGWSPILNFLNIIKGTIDQCSNILEDDNILCLSPGGVYEAQFGDENYELLWRNRMGFAKVALKSKVNVVPVFTVNIRKSYKTITFYKSFFLKLYEKTRLPFVPIYGGLPYKLTTYIGKPIKIDFEKNPSVIEIKTLIEQELKNLIKFSLEKELN